MPVAIMPIIISLNPGSLLMTKIKILGEYYKDIILKRYLIKNHEIFKFAVII
jgi:hypothetical protein